MNLFISSFNNHTYTHPDEIILCTDTHKVKEKCLFYTSDWIKNDNNIKKEEEEIIFVEVLISD
jgi:hypothetical protein